MLCAVGGLAAASCNTSAVVPPISSGRPGFVPPTAAIIPRQQAQQYPTMEAPATAASEDPASQYATVGPRALQSNWAPDAKPRDWSYIVIHHTASEKGSVESIHETHLKRKDGKGNSWLGIGYHFVIGNGTGMGDGVVEPTFRWREQMHGAHAGNQEYNQRGIGIALIGNFDQKPPSPKQVDAIRTLVTSLAAEYQISSANIIGHSDIKSTACPGKHFPLADIQRSVALQSAGGGVLIGTAETR